jgi:hypothetical protein
MPKHKLPKNAGLRNILLVVCEITASLTTLSLLTHMII